MYRIPFPISPSTCYPVPPTCTSLVISLSFPERWSVVHSSHLCPPFTLSTFAVSNIRPIFNGSLLDILVRQCSSPFWRSTRDGPAISFSDGQTLDASPQHGRRWTVEFAFMFAHSIFILGRCSVHSLLATRRKSLVSAATLHHSMILYGMPQ